MLSVEERLEMLEDNVRRLIPTLRKCASTIKHDGVETILKHWAQTLEDHLPEALEKESDEQVKGAST